MYEYLKSLVEYGWRIELSSKSLELTWHSQEEGVPFPDQERVYIEFYNSTMTYSLSQKNTKDDEKVDMEVHKIIHKILGLLGWL